MALHEIKQHDLTTNTQQYAIAWNSLVEGEKVASLGWYETR